jgi:cyclic pyranopterin phosphate synthase
MTGLSDSFHRPINYLRISVTDRCNLRCVYCMPPEGIALMPRSQILTYEEIYAVARAAAELGITKVRLTGGEPLARVGLADLVRMLSGISGIDDISLTTNGTLLAQNAAQLKAAGLRRVNVSLDSLRPERFHRITRGARLGEVRAGIEAARAVGLNPVKANMVVMRGINDDEVIDLANLTREGEWHVRFIELMPFGGNHGSERLVPVSEIEGRIRSLGELEPCLPSKGNGPARYFRLPEAPGTIGFISPVTEHFCIHCNRLRLTADGKLRPCLLSDAEIDLRGPLRQGASREEIQRLIEQAVASKPGGHHLGEGAASEGRPMAQIGG